MKIAILADIHGNSIALDNVLKDREVNHPAAGYIERFMKGENRKDWMK